MKITLITVPYLIEPDQMQEFIIAEYEKITGKRLPRMPRYDYTQFFTKGDLDRFL